MMKSSGQAFFLAYFFIIFTAVVDCQDILFPTDEDVTHLGGNNDAEITERIPVYIPGQCPENMLWYPGPGEKSTWICDCREGFLYFPRNHSCHEAYRRGPCKQGEYVILPVNEVVPTCTKNPCVEDGKVLFRGTCYNLKTKGGPCQPDVIGVNTTTFQLECISTDVAPFVIINAPMPPCPLGSRRNGQGLCRPPI